MKNSEWLNKRTEIAIEPDLEICDPHHHLWDYPASRYLAEELIHDLDSGHKVTSTVYIECASMYSRKGPTHLHPLGETQFVKNIVESFKQKGLSKINICQSIVSFADLTHKLVSETLDKHQNISERVVGIRHANAWHVDKSIRNAHSNPIENLFQSSNFLRGFKQLEKRGLSFDAWLYHTQISELTLLAKKFPDQIIVLDHLGGPVGIGPYADKRQEIFEYWKTAIRNLAECQNVFAKLGGMAMTLSGFNFHKYNLPPTSEDLASVTRDYYLYMIDTFGPERCMFESNFPVDRVSCSYAVLWNSFKKITRNFSESDKDFLFKGTAQRVYKLNP